MVVQSAMEEVRVCQVAPPPQLPVAPPPSATADSQQDDGEQSDPEVMQVTGEGMGPVNLRHKKQRMNGAVQLGVSWGGATSAAAAASGADSEERERPMSWEGELSEDEEDEDGGGEDAGGRGATHLGGGVVLIRPGNSPMLVERDDGANSPISLTTTPCGNSKDNNTGDKCVSRVNVSDSKASNHVITYVAPVSPAPSTPFGGVTPSVPAFQDRQHAHNSCFGEVSTSSRPSAMLGGAFQPPSSAFGESPILTPRPTSSSSSRSSYSPPSQSPLLGRGGAPQGPYPHASHQSPLPPRHGAASSDGSVYSPSSSPLQGRHVAVAEGGVYSPSQSPSQGRHRLGDGLSPTAAHLRNLSVSRNAYPPGGDVPVAPYPYLVVQPTPDTRSTASSASVASSASDESNASDLSSPTRRPSVAEGLADPLGEAGGGAAGVSRQQLLSGPCPVCGDRISGFHYGIFSCESCKGFFKRTVQNKKHYVCLRGANCPVAIATRKKCPACRFDKCLRTGMKLEAIREDRTRGGRSTYQCSYSLPAQLLDSRAASDSSESAQEPIPLLQKESRSLSAGSPHEGGQAASPQPFGQQPPVVPSLVQEIVSVEHLWHYTDREISRLSEQFGHKVSANNSVMEVGPDSPGASSSDGGSNLLSSLCNIADHRLYKIVKWCKSLPLFREIQVDDQIALLINSWCELLLLSCCYRSTGTPNEIRVSMGKSVTLGQARHLGMGPVIERMLGLTDLLRRLQVDQREFVCLKVIILLTSDASGLKEPEKVLACKKQVLEALQAYTISHYPTQPSKFGELLLCVPELERACQVSKESLAASRRIASSSAHLAASASAAAAAADPQAPSFNLLFELLRGDH
ncbi:nuclear hormone receptor FTZ-F1 beta [Ixodes scapularis]|uniref:nuclear hormone receptor FTZ-F1 beta n=1 Tax=Ixodes scapularis TaxID=6945 RepID=UPI001C38FF66|nr:nuclear hormone receptor FTZ-F1 beta [Ixodes scapularis]